MDFGPYSQNFENKTAIFRTVLHGRKRHNPFHGQASPAGVWSFLSPPFNPSRVKKKKEKTQEKPAEDMLPGGSTEVQFSNALGDV